MEKEKLSLSNRQTEQKPIKSEFSREALSSCWKCIWRLLGLDINIYRSLRRFIYLGKENKMVN